MTTKIFDFTLKDTPYLLGPEAWTNLVNKIKEIESDVALLRRDGKLTEETLRDYYGEKRWEQVCESNAIEGSTLNVGETQAAILKGMTLTGHDPAYVRDAKALDKALMRLGVLAKTKTPTDIAQITEIHSLIKEGQSGAGVLRSSPVIISGSSHTPPENWKDVMFQMEQWEAWSKSHAETSGIIRATILHAWLTHIHPFLDGNGRTARALSNLELIRVGIPPIIIKKTERARYIEALAESDAGGDISQFFQLILDRVSGALTGLELSAKKHQGYDKVAQKIREAQSRQLSIWNIAVELYFRVLIDILTQSVESAGGTISYNYFQHTLDLDDFIQISNGVPIGAQSWNFDLTVSIPGLPPVKLLCWTGFAPHELTVEMGFRGPALRWSRPNPAKFPPWVTVDEKSAPGVANMAIGQADGNLWYASAPGGKVIKYSTKDLARTVADGIIGLLGKI